MKIVCRYRKTITMNSVYELEKLVSNCSVADADTSSMNEIETTLLTPKARSDDQTVGTVGTKNGNQNHDAYHDERPNCFENMKYFSKEKPYNDSLQNQKEPTERLISEVKNLSYKQSCGTSEELTESINASQNNIHDGQDSLLTDVSNGNLEESLQSSSIESFPKTQGKTSLKISNDEKSKKIATSKKDL